MKLEINGYEISLSQDNGYGPGEPGWTRLEILDNRILSLQPEEMIVFATWLKSACDNLLKRKVQRDSVGTK